VRQVGKEDRTAKERKGRTVENRKVCEERNM
jgi:hypothetical protein